MSTGNRDVHTDSEESAASESIRASLLKLTNVSRKQLRNSLIASSIISAFSAVLIVVLGISLLPNQYGARLPPWAPTAYPIPFPVVLLLALGVSTFVGLYTYSRLEKQSKGIRDSQLRVLSLLSSGTLAVQSEEGVFRSLLEAGMIAARQRLLWRVQSRRQRAGQSLLYGAVAFLVAETLTWPNSADLQLPLLVGAIVWIYFRYEGQLAYRQEVTSVSESLHNLESRAERLVNEAID